MSSYYILNENIFEYTIIEHANVECRARIITFEHRNKFPRSAYNKLVTFLEYNQFKFSPNTYDIHIPNDEEMVRFKLLWDLS